MMIERYGPKEEMKLFGHIKHTSTYSKETIETVCVPQKKQRSTQT